MLDPATIHALLNALSSHDPKDRRAARAALLTDGLNIREILRQIAETGNPAVQCHAASILQLIHEREILETWQGLRRTPEAQIPIETGAILIARSQCLELQADEIFHQLDELAATLRPRLSGNLDPLDALNELLFNF